MRFGKWAAASLGMIGVLSTAADASGFHLFGSHKARPRAAASAPKPQPVHYRWSQGAAPQAYKDMVAELGTRGLKPGQYVWAGAIPAQGDTRIVLDAGTSAKRPASSSSPRSTS